MMDVKWKEGNERKESETGHETRDRRTRKMKVKEENIVFKTISFILLSLV